MEKDFAVTALYNGADLSKAEQCAQLVADAEKRLGKVDILVNNAGIQHVAPVESFPVERWDAIIAINLCSAFHTIRAALPGMQARGWGRIVNIASAHGLVASVNKVGLCHGQAWRDGHDQGGGAGERRQRHHLQRHLSRLGADARWFRSRSK